MIWDNVKFEIDNIGGTRARPVSKMYVSCRPGSDSALYNQNLQEIDYVYCRKL